MPRNLPFVTTRIALDLLKVDFGHRANVPSQINPLYRHKFEKVWLWEDWPKPKGVAAQDLGTDLIAQDTEGKIYAIQTKFYWEAKLFTYSHLVS